MQDYSNEIASQEGYDYYLIDNTAAIVAGTTRIKEISTWDKRYKTSRQIRIGSTLGEVVRAYPKVEFWFLFEWYDCVSCSRQNCVYLYDKATCTGFIFKINQFSQTQIKGIHETIGGTDFDFQFFVSKLSPSVYQSICSSVKVDQFILGDCENTSETFHVE